MNYSVIHGNALTILRSMPDASVNCCVTSPPYWGLRDYGHADQIGLEPTPSEFVAKLVAVFREVRRVLTADGTCWVNLGDSYNAYNGGAGPSSSISKGASTKERPALESGYGLRTKTLKPKDLVGIPWRVAFALQEDGWYLRQDIIWHKPNPMPESVRDRCTKAHEYVFLLTKSERYWWDSAAMQEPAKGWNGSSFDGDRDILLHPNVGRNRREERKAAGEGSRRGFSQNAPKGCSDIRIGETRNKRSVWTIATQPTPEAHFATYPLELAETCILAGCPFDGVVLDPFNGAGTTGLAALKNGRRYIGIELNAEYVKITRERAEKYMPLLISGL